LVYDYLAGERFFKNGLKSESAFLDANLLRTADKEFRGFFFASSLIEEVSILEKFR